VFLSNAANAAISKTTGAGTIVNDDGNVSAALAVAVPGDKHSLALTPNPASSIVRVDLKGYTGNVTIQLRTTEGKVLKQEKSVASPGKFFTISDGSFQLYKRNLFYNHF
jgi:hypothetical protein